MKKWIAFALLLALLAATVLSQAIANASPTTTRYTYTNARVPEAFVGYRILLIADLHNAPFADAILAIAEAEQPDLVLFCGDMAQLPRDSVSRSCRIAEALGERLPETAIYAVTGNHERQNLDCALIVEALTASGIVMLDDAFVDLERAGDVLRLAGLADPGVDYIMKHQYARAQTMVGDFFADRETLCILVNHRADMYPELKHAGADLILSGHLHGGVVRLPGVGSLIGHGGELFPDYAYGYYDGADGADLIVSGGCDKNPEKPRVFNRPEVVLVELARP